MDKINEKIEFLYRRDNPECVISMSLSPDAPLGEVLEAFEAFLSAVGYKFDGQIDVVNYGDPHVEEN